MFGATVLVPILFHINPGTVLLFNIAGTLLYLFICKGKIPAYLGSSFAFILPVLLLPLGGFILYGLLFCIVALILKKAGTGWIDVMFPPAAMGAIVAVIGLELAGVVANMAGLLPAEGSRADGTTVLISLVTLGMTVFGSVLFRGFLAIIPILVGVVVGYALSFAMGIVDCTPGLQRALVRAANFLYAALRMGGDADHSARRAGVDRRAHRPSGSDRQYREKKI
nr:Uracil transporter [Candidatus Pantoea persica]